MIFLRQSRRTSETQQANSDTEYERDAVERIYHFDRKVLAIAQMSYFDSYTFRQNIFGGRDKLPDNFVMYGAVHREFMTQMKHIHCEIEFTDDSPEDHFVGSCCLLRLLNESASEKWQKNDERTRLMLKVSIWDPNGQWAQKAYECLRDAAISGNQFCHFRVVTETIESGAALNELMERSYGPTIKLYEFTMWPTITLPKAPNWARREQW